MRVLGAVFVMLAAHARAHAIGGGLAELGLDGSALTLVLAPLAEHLPEVDDDGDGVVSTAEVRHHRAALEARFRSTVVVRSWPEPRLVMLDIAAPDDSMVPAASRYVRFSARYEVPSTVAGLEVQSPWGLWGEFFDGERLRPVALRAGESVPLVRAGLPRFAGLVVAVGVALAVLWRSRRRTAVLLMSATACGAVGPSADGGGACPPATSVTTGAPMGAFNVTARACTRTSEALACELGVEPRFRRITEGERVRLEANGVPSHDVGEFPNVDNPNALTPQTYALEVAAMPSLAPAPTPAAVFGLSTSGAVFDPNTAELWNGLTAWRYEALRYGSAPAYFASDSVRHPQGLGVDCNLAHVQPGGQYHYHGVPTALASSTPTLTVVGWAADGFPVVALWGRSNGALVEQRSSYRLRIGERPAPPAGPGGPFDGTFVQDWEFVAGLGDLDACNGRRGPVLVDGVEVDTYHYVLTRTFPFIPRCWSGTPDPSFTRLGAGQMAMTPPRCAAGQTSLCCGDGVCDGPETKASCADDC